MKKLRLLRAARLGKKKQSVPLQCCGGRGLVLQWRSVPTSPGRVMMIIDYCPTNYCHTNWGSPVPPARAKKRRRISAQPPVLPKATRAYAKKVEASRELSIKFLKEAGIIEKPGKLARPYR
jgi:hypothetical protein